MSELQAGMLALVVGYRNNPINLGKIVTLERFAKKGQVGIDAPASRDVWVISGEGVAYELGGIIITGNQGLVQPKHLSPIKPEADPLDVTHKEELHA